MLYVLNNNIYNFVQLSKLKLSWFSLVLIDYQVIQALTHVKDLRDFFLDPCNYEGFASVENMISHAVLMYFIQDFFWTLYYFDSTDVLTKS